MPPRPQASGPGALVREESGLLSGAISLCQRMAAEKERCGPALRFNRNMQFFETNFLGQVSPGRKNVFPARFVGNQLPIFGD
jgi:hypothetical protein